MKVLVKGVVLLLVGTVLTGCINSPNRSHPMFEPTEPMSYPELGAQPPTGSIYLAERNVSLFEDTKARQVGDIVTVVLAESTDAEKSSDTSLDRDSNNEIANPTVGGQTRTFGDFNLNFDLSSENSFSGESSSNQSNSLTGRIAVTVAEVLPNGNLYVQGEKWIHINQGKEYIRLRGIIRPVDISASNTILSNQVADARISYSGTGATAEVNMVGWLSRFFMGPLWPF